MDPCVAEVNDRLRAVVAGKRFLCTADVLQSAAAMAATLRSLGADRCFLIGGSRGTGSCDIHPEDEVVVLGLRADTMMGGIDGSEAAFADLSPEVLARIDAFDPQRQARVVGPLYAWSEQVAGRRLLGGRPWAWRRLEDKTLADALWDAAGVTRAPAQVVPVAQAPAAHRALDQGLGTVWSLDNREGWHGGANGLRWVRPDDDAAAVVADFGRRADQLRVMPFLEGIPCSIHGIVFPDAVLALRPMEMVVLRSARGELRYSRAASFWEPAAADRDEMREVARKVGRHLRQTVGYRGVFTVDGILTDEGFRPTELNPRYGAALAVMLRGAPDFHPYLLHCCIADGLDLDLDPAALEALMLELAEGGRSGGGLASLSRVITEEARADFVLGEDGWRLAAEGEDAQASARMGPASFGGIVFVELVPAHTPIGPPAAPRIAGVLEAADRLWSLGIGPLVAATPVR